MELYQKLKKLISKHVRDTPDISIFSLIDLDPSVLRNNGVTKIILDLDQTITVQGTATIPQDYLKQLNILKAELGERSICFLTNEPNPQRKAEVEKSTGIKVIVAVHRKPDKRPYLEALKYLGANPDKSVAMVGDRLWTDILGANRLNLFTIQVRPISPQKDSRAASIFRWGENRSQKFGLFRFIELLAAFLTISGTGLVQLWLYFQAVVIDSDLFSNPDRKLFFFNFIFLVASNVFYWTVTLTNVVGKKKGDWINKITFYFNTYPLFIRYIICWIFLGSSYHFHTTLPGILPLAHLYAFLVHLALLFSLSSSYHSDVGRAARIVGDILIVYLVCLNITPDWLYYAVPFLVVPVGTASRYCGWVTALSTVVACSALTFLLLSSQLPHAIVFSLLYMGTMLLIKIEYREAVNPLDRLIANLHETNTKSCEIPVLLRIFADVMNCEAVYLIRKWNEGYYFIQDHVTDYGQIPPLSSEELYNYLVAHPDNIVARTDSSQAEITRKQSDLLNDLKVQTLLRPPLADGIKSVLVCCIPHTMNEYLIFANNYTRNGVARKKFSLSHARTMYLCSTLLSNHL